MAVDWRVHQWRTSMPDLIACLICERVNPSCGWESPTEVQEIPGFGRWSVCQDCVNRRMVGAD